MDGDRQAAVGRRELAGHAEADGSERGAVITGADPEAGGGLQRDYGLPGADKLAIGAIDGKDESAGGGGQSRQLACGCEPRLRIVKGGLRRHLHTFSLLDGLTCGEVRGQLLALDGERFLRGIQCGAGAAEVGLVFGQQGVHSGAAENGDQLAGADVGAGDDTEVLDHAGFRGVNSAICRFSDAVRHRRDRPSATPITE